MNYRPICDVWILARPQRLKDGTTYYGSYPRGFLHRARALLGVSPRDAVLHVCAGKVREYPLKGLGKFDKTLDLDPALNPDYLHDARVALPWRDEMQYEPWASVLIDRPYTETDAANYVPGADALPPLNPLLKNALGVVPEGGRVGVLDYLWPSPPVFGTEVAAVAVGTGRNSRARWFTVWERLPL